MGRVIEGFNVHSDANLGSMEIALAISLILFGVLIIQAYNYYQNYDDRLILKSLVSPCPSTARTSLTAMLYERLPLCPGRSNPGPNSYPLATGVVLETLITALVQTYFGYRIYRLSGTLRISIVCWMLTLLRLGEGLALAAESYLNVEKQTNVFVLTNNYGWLITLAVSVGAFVDVLIALSLCFYIKRLAPPSPSQGTGALVDRLVTWTIRLIISPETGLITSLMRSGKQEHLPSLVAAPNDEFSLLRLNVRRKSEKIPAVLSGLVFTNHSRPEFTLDMTTSHSSSESFGGYPTLALPEKALDSKTSFRREIDLDLEARGI
ncbi:hypothetical protein FPV67DRAFT_1444558 [Lyophyllum atratum]|nr:hypothetical protein FPV67DRAFT_1444558 [Lyophyllum atratum]